MAVKQKVRKKRNRLSFTTHLGRNVKTQWLEGREYWVAPVTIMVEGVHDGSDGPVYYSGKMLNRHDPAWNHKPLVVYHPEDSDGGPLSASELEVVESSKVGMLLKTQTRNGLQKAQAWIEKSRARKIDPRIEKCIRNGLTMEVSTGMYATLEDKEGEWNGESFDSVVRSFRADHLALLPDQVGACSIGDGCGLQLNRAVSYRKARKVQRVVNSLLSSQKEKSTMLLTRQKKKLVVNRLVKGGHYKEADKKFLLSLNSRQLSNINKLAVTAAAKAKAQAKSDPDEEEDDDEAPARSTRNARRKKSAGTVLKKDESLARRNRPLENGDRRKKGCDCKITSNRRRKAAAEKKKVQSADQYIANAPREIRDMLKAGLNEIQDKRDGYIDTILENDSNDFTEKQLESMETTILKNMAKLADEAVDHEDEDVEEGAFIGNAGGARHRRTDNTETEEALDLPSTLLMNSDEEEDARPRRRRKKQSA